jgi:hypothetical protein
MKHLLRSNWKDQSPPASIPPDIKLLGLRSESTLESGSASKLDDLDIVKDFIAYIVSFHPPKMVEKGT